MSIRRRWIISISAAVVVVAVAAVLLFVVPSLHRPPPRPIPEAPPDLAKLRGAFQNGLDALRRGDGNDAVRWLSSFNFGHRAVEQYRLYFLANAWQLDRNVPAARVTLLKLWREAPRLVYWEDVGFNLANLYASMGDWTHAGEVERQIALRSDQSPVAAAGRWGAAFAGFVEGDVPALYENSRELAIDNPRTPQAADGIAVLRSLSFLGLTGALALTPGERLERAVCLMRDGDPENALSELNAMTAAPEPADLRMPIQLNRGLALHELHQYSQSNALLEPLASGPYRFAIPAIYHAAKNYAALAASINPIVVKTFIVRKRVGTIRVHVKGKAKPVLRPKYARVRVSKKLVDLAKKNKKEAYANLANERLRDLLALPVADPIRIEVLNALIELVEEKKDDAYERQLVVELEKLDPDQEAGLQHFWDEAWNAYTSGDLRGAIDQFDFIRSAYRGVNARRQAEYWRARALERLGEKEQAAAVYRSLASAPYDDLYAIFSESRGAPHADPETNPLTMPRPDWTQIAEQNMPAELRLAYELTALDDLRDARMEIQHNISRTNQTYAQALLADLYHSSGDTELMMRSIKRAFPQIATVDQDSVPAYFLSMYYPVLYRDTIVKYARRNSLDPYLVMALIHQESSFDPKARSRVGARGLMQLMPPTARELARQLHTSADMDNPDVSIRLGTFYFRNLINMFGGTVPLAIASYNAGLGNVIRWRRAAPHKPIDEFLESMPFAETRNYVKRVTIIRASYQRMAR